MGYLNSLFANQQDTRLSNGLSTDDCQEFHHLLSNSRIINTSGRGQLDFTDILREKDCGDLSIKSDIYRTLPDALYNTLRSLFCVCVEVISPCIYSSETKRAAKGSIADHLHNSLPFRKRLDNLRNILFCFSQGPHCQSSFDVLSASLLADLSEFKSAFTKLVMDATGEQSEYRAIQEARKNKGWDFVLDVLDDGISKSVHYLINEGFESFPKALSGTLETFELEHAHKKRMLNSSGQTTYRVNDSYSRAKKAILESAGTYTVDTDIRSQFGKISDNLGHRKSLLEGHENIALADELLSDLVDLADRISEGEFYSQSVYERRVVAYVTAVSRFQLSYHHGIDLEDRADRMTNPLLKSINTAYRSGEELLDSLLKLN